MAKKKKRHECSDNKYLADRDFTKFADRFMAGFFPIGKVQAITFEPGCVVRAMPVWRVLLITHVDGRREYSMSRRYLQKVMADEQITIWHLDPEAPLKVLTKGAILTHQRCSDHSEILATELSDNMETFALPSIAERIWFSRIEDAIKMGHWVCEYLGQQEARPLIEDLAAVHADIAPLFKRGETLKQLLRDVYYRTDANKARIDRLARKSQRRYKTREGE